MGLGPQDRAPLSGFHCLTYEWRGWEHRRLRPLSALKVFYPEYPLVFSDICQWPSGRNAWEKNSPFLVSPSIVCFLGFARGKLNGCSQVTAPRERRCYQETRRHWVSRGWPSPISTPPGAPGASPHLPEALNRAVFPTHLILVTSEG